MSQLEKMLSRCDKDVWMKTKKEFDQNQESICYVISVNLDAMEILYERFDDYREASVFYEQYKQDFPEYFTFLKCNKKAKQTWAKETFNLTL